MPGAMPGARPGPALVRQVEDTGTGILPDVLAQIGDACDPTKQNGRGTGQATDLGLSKVRGMIAPPDGFVTVQRQAAAAPPSAFSTPRPKAPSARRPSPPPSPSSTATANSASSSSPK